MDKHGHAAERCSPRACLLAAAAAWGFLPVADPASDGTPLQSPIPPAHVQSGSASGLGHLTPQLAPASELQQESGPVPVALSDESVQSSTSLQPAEQCKQAPPMSTANWWRLLPLQPGAYKRAIVFDTETSGFSNYDEILEIGAVELELRTPSSSSAPACLSLSTPEPTGALFHTLIASNKQMNPQAEKVHGIQQADLREAPPRGVALRRFLRFVGEDAALIAHNAPFDMRFLRQDLIRCGLREEATGLDGRSFCTVAAFRHLRGQNSASDLESACYLLRVSEGAPGSAWRRGHSALVDALLGAKLFIEIVKQAEHCVTTAASAGETPRASLGLVHARRGATLPMPWRSGETREVLGDLEGARAETLEATDEGTAAPAKRRRLPGSFS